MQGGGPNVSPKPNPNPDAWRAQLLRHAGVRVAVRVRVRARVRARGRKSLEMHARGRP